MSVCSNSGICVVIVVDTIIIKIADSAVYRDSEQTYCYRDGIPN